MLKDIPRSPYENLDSGVGWLGSHFDSVQPENNRNINPIDSTEWDHDYGEYIHYGVVCAAWQDELGNAWIVRKSDDIDDSLAKDWLVLHYDAIRGDLTRRAVQSVDTLRRDYHNHIHFLLNEPDSNSGEANFSVLEFYVNHNYQPMHTGATRIVNSKRRIHYSQPIDGVEYDQSNLPLYSEGELEHMGYETGNYHQTISSLGLSAVSASAA